MRRAAFTAIVPLVLSAFAPSGAAQNPPTLLPDAPNSVQRSVPIEALKSQGPALASAFAPHVYKNAKGESMPYRLYTPAKLEPGRTYPLVLFLHGAGGSGTDNIRQLQGANVFGALTWTRPEIQQRHPAFVVAPQSDVNWACTVFDPKNPPKIAADITWCPPDVLGIGARMAFEIVDRLLETLPIDRGRIYVTGHSMGGAGTWHMIAQRPRFFAAAVPVCGHPTPSTAGAVKDVPVWNFHGAADDVEPATSSRVMIDALRKAGGRPLHTEYAGIGHNVFMWAYTEPALIEWLFAQKRCGLPHEPGVQANRNSATPAITRMPATTAHSKTGAFVADLRIPVVAGVPSAGARSSSSARARTAVPADPAGGIPRAAIGAMIRYPRLWIVSMILGCLASSPSATLSSATDRASDDSDTKRSLHTVSKTDCFMTVRPLPDARQTSTSIN